MIPASIFSRFIAKNETITTASDVIASLAITRVSGNLSERDFLFKVFIVLTSVKNCFHFHITPN